jgi:hypothetical protein
LASLCRRVHHAGDSEPDLARSPAPPCRTSRTPERPTRPPSIDTKIDERLFGDALRRGAEVIDTMWALHQAHEHVRASPQKAFRLADLRALAGGLGTPPAASACLAGGGAGLLLRPAVDEGGDGEPPQRLRRVGHVVEADVVEPGGRRVMRFMA